jgi:hypothetical protein
MKQLGLKMRQLFLKLCLELSMDDHKKDSKKFRIYLFGLLVTGIHPPLVFSYCRHVLVWHVQYLAFLSVSLSVQILALCVRLFWMFLFFQCNVNYFLKSVITSLSSQFSFKKSHVL